MIIHGNRRVICEVLEIFGSMTTMSPKVWLSKQLSREHAQTAAVGTGGASMYRALASACPTSSTAHMLVVQGATLCRIWVVRL